MKIINRANGQETSLSAAVSVVVDCDNTWELRNMVTRLIEELTFTADDTPPVLNARQLSRVLEYKFRVED